jgi:glycine hydroxymethyltransferase
MMPIEDSRGTLPEVDTVYDLLEQHEKWIDKSCLNLYPASNIMSERARAVLASPIATRVAEGDVGKKYQTGTKYLEQIEVLTADLLERLFHANFAEARILSGTMANAIVFGALTEPGDTIMALSTPAGGHISHNKLGVAGYHRLITNFLDFDPEAMNIDVEAFQKKAAEIRPRLVILGGSQLLFPPPIYLVKQALEGLDTLLLFDMAHVAGLVAGERFPNPLDEGADILTSSTYKTFPGPPGGFIACNDESIFKKIRRATFPGMTASFHGNAMAALAITCIEMFKFGREYAEQIVTNSKSLAEELDIRGFEVLGKKYGYSETHQVVLDVTALGGGHRCAKLLESANIICNKNLLFHDPPRKAFHPSGLRIGVQEVARLGMKESEMRQIAEFFSAVLLQNRPPSDVAIEVKTFRSQYQTIHYC